MSALTLSAPCPRPLTTITTAVPIPGWLGWSLAPRVQVPVPPRVLPPVLGTGRRRPAADLSSDFGPNPLRFPVECAAWRARRADVDLYLTIHLDLATDD